MYVLLDIWYDMARFGRSDRATIELKLFLSVTLSRKYYVNSDLKTMNAYYSSHTHSIAVLFKFTFYITFRQLSRLSPTQILGHATDCHCAGHHRQAGPQLRSGDCFRVNWPTLTLHIFFRISLFFTSSLPQFSLSVHYQLLHSKHLSTWVHHSQNAGGVFCDYLLHRFHVWWD